MHDRCRRPDLTIGSGTSPSTGRRSRHPRRRPIAGRGPNLAVQLLQADHGHAVPLPVGDAGGRGSRGGHSGQAGHLMEQGRRTDAGPVGARAATPWRIDHEWTRPEEISSTASARRTRRPCPRPCHRQAVVDSRKPPSRRSPQARSRVGKSLGRLEPGGLVAVGEREQDRPLRRQAGCRPRSGFWRRRARRSVPIPMTSPVERISGPSNVSTPGKRLKGARPP